jgi:hypothetical protein
MNLTSAGTYPRNTLDVEAGLDSIVSGAHDTIDAVVMIGTGRALAKFVKLSKQTQVPLS